MLSFLSGGSVAASFQVHVSDRIRHVASRERQCRPRARAMRSLMRSSSSSRRPAESFPEVESQSTVSEPIEHSIGDDAGFPSCFPQMEACEIRDPSAISMMRITKTEPVRTPFSDEPILTSYVHVGAQANSSSSFRSVQAAVVFLHGFDSNLLEFRRLVPFMTSNTEIASYHVDLLGWGFTSKPDGLSYSVDQKRQHLRSWIKQVVGDVPLVLAGASIGGAVAIDYALAYPSEVSKLVLIDAQAYTDKIESPYMQYIPWLASFGAQVLKAKWLRRIAVRLSYETSSLISEDTLNIGRLHCLTPGWENATVQFVRSQHHSLIFADHIFFPYFYLLDYFYAKLNTLTSLLREFSSTKPPCELCVPSRRYICSTSCGDC